MRNENYRRPISWLGMKMGQTLYLKEVKACEKFLSKNNRKLKFFITFGSMGADLPYDLSHSHGFSRERLLRIYRGNPMVEDVLRFVCKENGIGAFIYVKEKRKLYLPIVATLTLTMAIANFIWHVVMR